MKSGAIDRLSIGYSVRRERRARDGATELLDVDLKEVSLVMNPANERARLLAIKSGAEDAEPDVPTDVEMRRRWAELKASVPRRRSAAQPQREFDRHRLDTIMDGVPRHDRAPAAPSAAELRREWERLRLELLTDTCPCRHPNPCRWYRLTPSCANRPRRSASPSHRHAGLPTTPPCGPKPVAKC